MLRGVPTLQLLMSLLLLISSLIPHACAASIALGDLRVSALSPTLLRFEPKGPLGFEDRNTFVAAARSSFGDGIPISKKNETPEGTWLTAGSLDIFVPATSETPLRRCGHNVSGNVDAASPKRSDKYPNGTHVASAAACCAVCIADPGCTAWTFSPGVRPGSTQVSCYPLKSAQGTKKMPVKHQRVVGAIAEPSSGILVARSADGQLLWSADADADARTAPSNLLHWPSPLEDANVTKAYALADSPRFVVPSWGPVPLPPDANASGKLDPAVAATNGYDFRNNPAKGQLDTYLFILGGPRADAFGGGGGGGGMASWWASRAEFLALSGPTPVLPDWGYGAWYTWYIPYTEEEAKEDAGNWTAGGWKQGG